VLTRVLWHDKSPFPSEAEHLYERMPGVLIDIYRDENKGIRSLGDDEKSVFSPTPFSQLGDTQIGGNTDNDSRVNYDGKIEDKHDHTADNTANLAYNFLNYTYGKERYIIKSSFGFYVEDKYQYLVGDLEPSAHFYRQKVLGKLQLISVAVDYFITQDENKDIKNEIKNGLSRLDKRVAISVSKLIPKLISKHFGLDGDEEQSRFELCDIYDLKIESIDSYILKSLEIIFEKDPKMFNKALKFSLTIEDEFIKENIYPLPHNLYSILTEEESRFLKCRYDWKKGIFKDLNQVANDLNTDITELIEIERRVIEKLKQYEPETFPKIGAIFKANIESGNIQSSFDKNSLFMLSSLQFEIINLRHGITTSEKLSKEDIIEKLSIDAQTYDKEYKNAVSILREFRLNTNES
jgi:hypothetical protein